MLIAEDTISNPQVLAGTPPPYIQPPRPPEQTLTAYWYAERRIRPIDSTTCSGIAAKAQEYNTFLQFHVATLRDVTVLGGFNSQNPPPKLDTRSQAGMQQDIPSRTDELMCGTFLRPTGALMSTPFHGTDRRFFRNLVENHPENVNESTTVYFWQLGYNSDRSTVRPREDGSVSVTPLSRRDDTKRTISLPVVANETAKLPDYTTVYKNNQVNAFTLVIGVQQGPEYNSSQTAHSRPIPWRITVKFGEMEVYLEEGRPEVKIKIGSRFETLTINPGAASRTRSDAGPQSYELTFIPVWNGVVFADSSPSSANWAEKTFFVKKNQAKTIFREYEAEFHKNLNKEQPGIPRFGTDGSLLPTPGTVGAFTPTDNPDSFAGAAANPVKKGCLLPATDDVSVDFGSTVTVEYERCGGTIRFIPVFFSRAIRSYMFKRGEHVPQTMVSRTCPNWPEVPHVFPVPVYHYQGNDRTSNQPYMWIQEQSDPAHILAFETERETKGYRRPVEVWGYVLTMSDSTNQGATSQNQSDNTVTQTDYPSSSSSSPGSTANRSSVDVANPANVLQPDEEGDIQGLQFRTAEGFLTNWDVPAARIRRVTVTRGLDGMSGQIEWDRYDPILGLWPRPTQRVGALRLAVVGGRNTVPGVIYTGIAMGNAESDSHDANTVTIPLYGRECKMTDSEGGLRIINAPFFDACDHREVIAWMANYAGVPFVSLSRPYRLPAGSIMSPVVDIKTGTPVWDGILEIAKLGSTICFFNRWGVLVQMDVATTSGINWLYPVHKIESYDDKPDLSQMRDTVVIAGLVGAGEIDPMQIINPQPGNMNPDVQPMMIARQFDTVPRFPWSKMMFYALQGIVDRGKLRRAAIEIARGVTRARATGSVTVPGNANFELLDTFNGAWAITSITHNIDLQSKTWSTSLSLELLMGFVPDDNQGAGVPPAGGEAGAQPGPANTPGSSSMSTIGTNPSGPSGVDTNVTPDPAGGNPP